MSIQNRYPKEIGELMDFLYKEHVVVPPFYNEYFSAKKSRFLLIIISLVCIGSAIFLYSVFVLGQINALQYHTINYPENILKVNNRVILLIIFSGIYVVIAIFIGKISYNRNWFKSILTLSIFYTILIDIMVATGSTVYFFWEAIYIWGGTSWAPSLMAILITYILHKNYTDIGILHYNLSLIYYDSAKKEELPYESFLNFYKELDKVIRRYLGVIIKNRNELIEGYFEKLLKDSTFIKKISQNNRDLFGNLLNIFSAEDILIKEEYLKYKIKKDEEIIPQLPISRIRDLNYEIFVKALPFIYQLTKNLTDKDISLNYYTFSQKIKNSGGKIVSLVIFVVTGILPLIISLFIV